MGSSKEYYGSCRVCLWSQNIDSSMFTLKHTKLNVLLLNCNVLTEFDTKQSTMDTYVINPITSIRSAMTDFFKNRPVIAEMYNFMRGFVLHQNYSKSSNFLAWKGRYLMSDCLMACNVNFHLDAQLVQFFGIWC